MLAHVTIYAIVVYLNGYDVYERVLQTNVGSQYTEVSEGYHVNHKVRRLCMKDMEGKLGVNVNEGGQFNFATGNSRIYA